MFAKCYYYIIVAKHKLNVTKLLENPLTKIFHVHVNHEPPSVLQTTNAVLVAILSTTKQTRS